MPNIASCLIEPLGGDEALPYRPTEKDVRRRVLATAAVLNSAPRVRDGGRLELDGIGAVGAVDHNNQASHRASLIAYPSSARRACRDRPMADLCRATQCHPNSISRGG
jgi:hypothetical protein